MVTHPEGALMFETMAHAQTFALECTAKFPEKIIEIWMTISALRRPDAVIEEIDEPPEVPVTDQWPLKTMPETLPEFDDGA